jgi:hypothetical protein
VEKQEYSKFAVNPLAELVRTDKEGRVFWNWQYQRELILLSTWTGMKKIERKFMARHTAGLLRRKEDLLLYIIKLYCKKNKLEVPETLDKQLAMLIQGAPKLRGLLSLVRSVVVRRQEKLTLFVTLPGQLVLVMAMFWAVGLSAAALYSGMTNAEKAATVKRFTDEAEPMILVGSMKGMSVGYNLQSKCHWAVFMDPPPSQPLGDSAAARVHRLGQTEPVEVVTLTVPNTFNDRQIQNNLRKAIPNVMAMMDSTIFGAETGGDVLEEENELQTGKWVNFKGRLILADDPEVAALDLPVLQGMDLVKQILFNKMGVEASSAALQDPAGSTENVSTANMAETASEIEETASEIEDPASEIEETASEIEMADGNGPTGDATSSSDSSSENSDDDGPDAGSETGSFGDADSAHQSVLEGFFSDNDDINEY